MKRPEYVLLTAARDEAHHLDNTVESVLRQTMPPSDWVIVNDGSRDETEQILRAYSSRHSWIQVLSRPASEERNFASKVQALNLGLGRLQSRPYEFLGILDADVSLPPDYYQVLLAHFAADPGLGISGGVCQDTWNGKPLAVRSGPGHVRGAVQIFRRRCLEQIGGFVPLPWGGEDALVQFMARMHGWRVKCVDSLRVLHHRPTGTARAGVWRARFRQGACDQQLGYHPFFEAAKCAARLGERPWVLGSILRWSGFVWSFLQRQKSPVPDEVVEYLRREQLRRLRLPLRGMGLWTFRHSEATDPE